MRNAKALDTIDLLYQAALEPELWPAALHAFAEATGGFGTAMIPITPGDTTGLVVSPALAEARVEYDKEWWQHDTRVRRIFARGLKAGVCCEAELFSDAEIKRDLMRQEFCRPYGMGAFAAQLVSPWPGLVVAFSVQRQAHLGHFEKHHLEALGLLGKHAARALLISLRLAAVRRFGDALVTTLDRFDSAALLVDHRLRVTLANQAAERLLGDGLTIVQGRLRTSHHEQQDALEQFVGAVLDLRQDSDDVGPIALRRASGRPPLLLQAIPIRTAPEEVDPLGPAALILVVDPDQDPTHSPDKGLRLLGLTPSEARLAVLLGVGHSRAQAAEMLGITANTAADTVKQIYSKLGLTRQSSLVRLVARLATLERAR